MVRDYSRWELVLEKLEAKAMPPKPPVSPCSLYLSLMDRFGVTLDRFGDATQRLEGL